MSEMDIEALSRSMRGRLAPIYGEGEARGMVRLIFHALKGWSATDMVVHGDSPASEWLVQKCDEMVSRVLAGEPVQYVTGEAYFYGMDLHVEPGVLIPRPETAELVDMIVRENPYPDMQVLDVGTGSGAIAIALARNLKFARVAALDVSAAACEIARKNAAALHVKLAVEQADIFTYQPPADTFDIIVSNPPYITEKEREGMERNVLEHEPSLALFVPDENPLIYYGRIAEVGMKGLRRGGRLYFEINPLYADDLKAMLHATGYEDVELTRDAYNRVRFAKAVR